MSGCFCVSWGMKGFWLLHGEEQLSMQLQINDLMLFSDISCISSPNLSAIDLFFAYMLHYSLTVKFFSNYISLSYVKWTTNILHSTEQ